MDEIGSCNLEVVIDRILFSARDLKKKIDFAKDNRFRVKSNSEPVDVQKMRELEKENIELRQALEDHQYGLEFIMSKYRSQITELIRLNKAEESQSSREQNMI